MLDAHRLDFISNMRVFRIAAGGNNRSCRGKGTNCSDKMLKSRMRVLMYVNANKTLQLSFAMSTSSLLFWRLHLSTILSLSVYIQINQNCSCQVWSLPFYMGRGVVLGFRSS